MIQYDMVYKQISVLALTFVVHFWVRFFVKDNAHNAVED